MMMYNDSTPADGTANIKYEMVIPDYKPNTEIVILSVILSFFCVLGTIGNALAFIIYNRKREKGTSTIFILSLAVTDFLTCLINIPYTITSLLLEYRLEYDVLCKMFLYIGTFNVPLSSLIIVAIGIDRYLCICHPFLHIVTVPRAKACVIFLTFVSALLGIIPALSHAVYRHSLYENAINPADSSILESASFPSNDSGERSTVDPSNQFTNGLSLKPAVGFISDIARPTASEGYTTDNSTLISSTLGTPKTWSFSNIATSTKPQTVLKVFINRSSDAYFDGICAESEDILSKDFVVIYKHIYAGTFLFEFFILALLYALIYRSILVRRAWKTKRKRMSCYTSTTCNETIAEETQLTNINGGAAETVVLKKNAGRFSSAMRDRTLHANIKTASMLFVVTVGFVVSFLPSWLMGLRVTPVQISVFYLFYINNVINPVIYAFMNRAFRDDLFQLLKSIFRR